MIRSFGQPGPSISDKQQLYVVMRILTVLRSNMFVITKFVRMPKFGSIGQCEHNCPKIAQNAFLDFFIESSPAA